MVYPPGMIDLAAYAPYDSPVSLVITAVTIALVASDRLTEGVLVVAKRLTRPLGSLLSKHR